MFKPSFKSKSTATLGIDIGTQTAKVVKIAPKGGKPFVEFCGLIPLNGAINIVETLHHFLADNHLLGLKATAAIDDSTFKTAKIDLPKMPQADLKEAVRWKMRDFIEGTIDEYVVRYTILNEFSVGEVKKMMVLGYVIKKSAVDHLLKLLQKVGLKPEVIEPAPVSLAASVQKETQLEWVAGIDLGATKANMVILGQEHLYLSRQLSHLAAPGAKAPTDGLNQKLAVEIQTTLDTLAVNFQVEKINRILLCGGGAGTVGLAEYLTKNLGVETKVMDPFKGLEIDPAVAEGVGGRPYLFTQAVSLALLP